MQPNTTVARGLRPRVHRPIIYAYTLQVKTLRGHKVNIKSVAVVGGRSIDWENPGPPLVVTLSEDRCIKAWDVVQVRPCIVQ